MSLASRLLAQFSGQPSSSDSIPRPSADLHGEDGHSVTGGKATIAPGEEARPPYLHAMLAGGLGGSTGDVLMHSLDTVKTRQQGASAAKYATTPRAYYTIFREEGLLRGLYSGVTPAFLGSLPGTVIFFGTYEFSKRHLIDAGCPAALAYLTSGFLGDLFASVIYVPSEVLKTRLQLQGRYNNPHFKSGYNYRGTLDAARTIVRAEGAAALFYGYKATIMRDLPFSALQFAFYEQFQKSARGYRDSRDIGLGLEIATGALAGGLAGTITCPLDVVKTRLQTQVRTKSKPAPPPPAAQTRAFHTCPSNLISPSTPTTPRKQGSVVKLNTSSVFKGLGLIYRSEGLAGWFRGVGPRAVWTSVQSSIMLVMYQSLLKQMHHWGGSDPELEPPPARA